MTVYSNPRREAIIENWPSGRKHVTARFWIEIHPKRGERACRQTTGKPKKLTYAPHFCIVDGDDGRTYLLHDSNYGHITVMEGNMKFEHESEHPEGDRSKYNELSALLAEVTQ